MSRSAPTAGRRRLSTALVAVTAAAAGLLFAASASTADGTDLRAGGRLQLAELIARERARLTVQDRAAAVLREQVAAASASSAVSDGAVAAEQARGRALELAAGVLPVDGPAVTVSLDDAPQASVADDPDDLVVHQQDVQSVVNALWAGGAEAMTLMGQRVVSTSAVRCVGNTIVLQGQVYGPPFVVTAVGDLARLRAALSAEPGVTLFLRYVDRFGLGYAVTSVDDAHLPAYSGPLELASVAPAG